MRKLRSWTFIGAIAALIYFAAIASATIPSYTGFTPRSPGYVVTATEWNAEFTNLINFINQYFSVPLSAVTAHAGNILTSDGSNLQTLVNTGTGQDGSVLTSQHTAPYGIEWAGVTSGITLLTQIGDLLTYNGSANAVTSIGGAANGSCLVTDNTTPNGISWQNILPKGTILCWDSGQGAIPTHWHLCDGTTVNGITLPNMQGCYIVGAGQTSPAATGGLGNITPNTLAGDVANGGGVGATYTTSTPSANQLSAAGNNNTFPSVAHTHYLTVTPRYFAIQYIEKVD